MTDSRILWPDCRESTNTTSAVSLHITEAGRPGEPLLVLLHRFQQFGRSDEIHWIYSYSPIDEAASSLFARQTAQGLPDFHGDCLTKFSSR